MSSLQRRIDTNSKGCHEQTTFLVVYEIVPANFRSCDDLIETWRATSDNGCTTSPNQSFEAENGWK